jgi:DNA-binding beta-propeller fold protein YncE
LQVKEPDGPLLWMKIKNLEVRSDTSWLPVRAARQELQSQEIAASGQIFAGRGGVPAGRYQAMRFTVEEGALEREGKRIFLALDNPVVEINFPAELTLAKEDSPSLFLTWDTSQSLQGMALLSPKMTIATQSIPLVSDLAYVSCPEQDTIYIIRTDRNMVCGSIGVSGKPGSIIANPAQNRLFVLARQEATVKILELTANRQIDQIRVPLSAKPTYMTVSPDAKWAYLLDEMGNSLLRLNLQTGVLGGQARTGSRPKFILYMEEQNLLAVSSAYSQKIFLLDPVSLAIVRTIDTGGTPDGLFVRDNYLYVAESSSNSVSVFELPGGRNKGRFNVGSKPRRFAFSNNHIYIANSGGGTVSVFRPGQLNISRDVRVGGMPFEMDVSPARQWLYVCDAHSGGVTVIDLSLNKVVGRIELGAVPDTLEVIN